MVQSKNYVILSLFTHLMSFQTSMTFLDAQVLHYELKKKHVYI